MPMTLDSLVELLKCPKSKASLLREGNFLICLDPNCRLRYEIKDDIPVMLIDEALELSPEDWGKLMQQHGRDPLTGQPAVTG